VDAIASPEEILTRLSRAGWSIGEAAVETPAGPRYFVTCTNVENRIDARGATSAEPSDRPSFL
jgi:hypothetical protein